MKEVREYERFGEEGYGEKPRRFIPMGTATFLFVLVGAYRTSPNSFGVAGMGSKALHMLSNPAFECSWVPNPSSPSKSNSSSEVSLSRHTAFSCFLSRVAYGRCRPGRKCVRIWTPDHGNVSESGPQLGVAWLHRRKHTWKSPFNLSSQAKLSCQCTKPGLLSNCYNKLKYIGEAQDLVN